MVNVRSLALLSALVVMLSACTAPSQNVQGIGSGADAYKQSPCAGCGPLIPQPNTPRNVLS